MLRRGYSAALKLLASCSTARDPLLGPILPKRKRFEHPSKSGRVGLRPDRSSDLYTMGLVSRERFEARENAKRE